MPLQALRAGRKGQKCVNFLFRPVQSPKPIGTLPQSNPNLQLSLLIVRRLHRQVCLMVRPPKGLAVLTPNDYDFLHEVVGSVERSHA